MFPHHATNAFLQEDDDEMNSSFVLMDSDYSEANVIAVTDAAANALDLNADVDVIGRKLSYANVFSPRSQQPENEEEEEDDQELAASSPRCLHSAPPHFRPIKREEEDDGALPSILSQSIPTPKRARDPQSFLIPVRFNADELSLEAEDVSGSILENMSSISPSPTGSTVRSSIQQIIVETVRNEEEEFDDAEEEGEQEIIPSLEDEMVAENITPLKKQVRINLKGSQVDSDIHGKPEQQYVGMESAKKSRNDQRLEKESAPENLAQKEEDKANLDYSIAVALVTFCLLWLYFMMATEFGAKPFYLFGISLFEPCSVRPVSNPHPSVRASTIPNKEVALGFDFGGNRVDTDIQWLNVPDKKLSQDVNIAKQKTKETEKQQQHNKTNVDSMQDPPKDEAIQKQTGTSTGENVAEESNYGNYFNETNVDSIHDPSKDEAIQKKTGTSTGENVDEESKYGNYFSYSCAILVIAAAVAANLSCGKNGESDKLRVTKTVAGPTNPKKTSFDLTNPDELVSFLKMSDCVLTRSGRTPMKSRANTPPKVKKPLENVDMTAYNKLTREEVVLLLNWFQYDFSNVKQSAYTNKFALQGALVMKYESVLYNMTKDQLSRALHAKGVGMPQSAKKQEMAKKALETGF